MKIARLKGYAPIWIVGSRSDGLGFKGAGSNRGRCKRIWRSRAKGRGGGGGRRRRRAPVAGVRRQWPVLAFQGSKGTETGSGGDYATHVVHLGLSGFGEAPQGLATAEHGGATARTLVADVLASRVRHGRS